MSFDLSLVVALRRGGDFPEEAYEARETITAYADKIVGCIALRHVRGQWTNLGFTCDKHVPLPRIAVQWQPDGVVAYSPSTEARRVRTGMTRHGGSCSILYKVH